MTNQKFPKQEKHKTGTISCLVELIEVTVVFVMVDSLNFRVFPLYPRHFTQSNKKVTKNFKSVSLNKLFLAKCLRNKLPKDSLRKLKLAECDFTVN